MLRQRINKIKSYLKKNIKLRKEKYSQNSRYLISMLIKEEQVREKKEVFEENQRQINLIDENIENKKMQMIQAEDMFGEFEKHFSRIRVANEKYSNFNLKGFIDENCWLIRSKQKRCIRTYFINQTINNKNEEIKEFKIFLRSLDLWKGITIENTDGNSFFTNSPAITFLQNYCHELLSKITIIEQNILNLSIILVGWLNHITEYSFAHRVIPNYLKEKENGNIPVFVGHNFFSGLFDKYIFVKEKDTSNRNLKINLKPKKKCNQNSNDECLIKSNYILEKDDNKNEKENEIYPEKMEMSKDFVGDVLKNLVITPKATNSELSTKSKKGKNKMKQEFNFSKPTEYKEDTGNLDLKLTENKAENNILVEEVDKTKIKARTEENNEFEDLNYDKSDAQKKENLIGDEYNDNENKEIIIEINNEKLKRKETFTYDSQHNIKDIENEINEISENAQKEDEIKEENKEKIDSKIFSEDNTTQDNKETLNKENNLNVEENTNNENEIKDTTKNELKSENKEEEEDIEEIQEVKEVQKEIINDKENTINLNLPQSPKKIENTIKNENHNHSIKNSIHLSHSKSKSIDIDKVSDINLEVYHKDENENDEDCNKNLDEEMNNDTNKSLNISQVEENKSVHETEKEKDKKIEEIQINDNKDNIEKINDENLIESKNNIEEEDGREIKNNSKTEEEDFWD